MTTYWMRSNQNKKYIILSAESDRGEIIGSSTELSWTMHNHHTLHIKLQHFFYHTSNPLSVAKIIKQKWNICDFTAHLALVLTLTDDNKSTTDVCVHILYPVFKTIAAHFLTLSIIT